MPATRVVVLMPFRGVDQWRTRAQEAAVEQIRHLPWPLYVADSGDQPWSIARTWNLLSDLADADGRWDVAVRWAADMRLLDVASVHEAVARCRFYTAAFDQSIRLTEAETRVFYRRGRVPARRDTTNFGGVTVITREAWDLVGGYDRRFVGYGAEDYAFVHGMELHYGARERVAGIQISLWHPASRGRAAARSDSGYWGRRAVNLEMYEREIKPISTPEGWAAYLAAR